ncbi:MULTISPECIES: SMI1/KNR4 family protein [Kitasatospora]|uniref:Knr4/Smi1-like domain-containing protein n=1 Tax=Kitasatospora setae (strain ATCC 33774 / DSM 43861 / JCM 3304 / KCC A-0304 / NBRC 14216 / KM-6054) TaxID=452652 RepID=E4N5L7_KITSK|nr:MULTISPECIES: SMI1/KNR4 family protein [Kitasatospora]BAJ26498.1 hypothetical protein KSE_06580 [Kitasatospora setae KM-6054]
MDRARWRELLGLWSGEWITARQDDPGAGPLAPEVLRDRWLGFAPATEAAVAAAEARLGRPLPPSLREFLLVTDGWRNAGLFIERMAGTTELAWLRDTPDRTWIRTWEGLAEDAGEGEDTDGDGDADDHDAWLTRQARVLARSLRLSLAGDSAVMLLDPEDVDEDGEWAGYWLASWSGLGPERFGSFAELMYRQWRSLHAVCRPAGPTRDFWDGETERGRRAALAGELDTALDLLEEAQAFGRPRAGLLATQLRALLHGWERELPGAFRGARDQETYLAEPLFSREFLPVLLRQEREARHDSLLPLPGLRESAPEPTRAAIAAYEAASAEPGFRLVFGPPEFDAAVHALVERLAAHRAAAREAQRAPAVPPPGVVVLTATVTRWVDGQQRPAPPVEPRFPEEFAERAWAELLAAMPLWRPLDANHLAPVSLLAEPLLAELVTHERAHALLSIPRG